MINSPELEVAREAALAGGEIVARYFREGVTIRSKETYNLVSDADEESEHAIAAIIQNHYPDHAILGEESYAGDIEAEHLWIIDPLDGTNNFAHDIPHFTISIAYWRDQQPVCGVIYNPVREDWMITAKGQGAWQNNKQVHVSDEDLLSKSILGVGFYYDRGAVMEVTLHAIRDLFYKDIHGIRRFGTASLDLTHVANGCFGAYFEYELSPWDFAAGLLFVEEAGGTVTTCRGKPLPLQKTSVLASNGKLHSEVLEIVGKYFPDEKEF